MCDFSFIVPRGKLLVYTLVNSQATYEPLWLIPVPLEHFLSLAPTEHHKEILLKNKTTIFPSLKAQDYT